MGILLHVQYNPTPTVLQIRPANVLCVVMVALQRFVPRIVQIRDVTEDGLYMACLERTGKMCIHCTVCYVTHLIVAALTW